jgi:hypothetical protein
VARSTTGQVQTNLNFVRTDQNTVSQRTLSDVSVLNPSVTFSNGTGNIQIDAGYLVTGILASGAIAEFDVGSLTQFEFGLAQTINFARDIKGLVVTNNTSNISGVFHIASTGASGIVGLFDGTGNIPIYAGGAFTFVNQAGLTVTSTTRKFQLINGNVENKYSIGIVGATGV